MKLRLIALSLILFSFAVQLPARAETLALGVQPMLADRCAGTRFQDLGAYLGDRLGATVLVSPITDNRDFREKVRVGDYDIVIATSNFLTGSRIDRYLDVVATSATLRNYQLLTYRNSGIGDPRDLIGKAVAGETAPSRSAKTFVEMFPNPVRQPGYQPTRSTDEAWNLFRAHNVDAILVPTLGDACSHEFIKVIADRAVHLEVSVGVARHLLEEDRAQVREALLSVGYHSQGLRALDAGVLTGFKPVQDSMAAELAM